MTRVSVPAFVLWAMGCGPQAPASSAEAISPKPTELTQVEAPSAQPAPTSQPAPAAATAKPGERAFGAPLSATGEPIDVAAVLRDPKPLLGKNVKVRGIVARVCERAGCWLELRPEAGEGGLRVPMANHAFSIPQDVAGRTAIVEGALSAQALSPSHQEHLEGEGAQAVGPLALEARSVVVR